MKERIAATVPMKMKGVRLPNFVITLSERAPKIGSINTARTLSTDITTPEIVCGRPKWLVNARGTIASYACQKALIRKNAKPTRIVRL